MDSDISSYKIFSGVADGLFIICWLVVSCFSFEAIIKVDFEPEEWARLERGEQITP